MDMLSKLSSLSSHLENCIFRAIEKNTDFVVLIEYVLFSNTSSDLPISNETKNILSKCYTSNIQLNTSLNLCLKALKHVTIQASDLSYEIFNSQSGIDNAIFRENEVYDVIMDKFIDLRNEDEQLSKYFSCSKFKLIEECTRLRKIAANLSPLNSTEFNTHDVPLNKSLFRHSLKYYQEDVCMRQSTSDSPSQSVDVDYLNLFVLFNQQSITMDNYKAINSHLINLVFDKFFVVKLLFQYNLQLIEVKGDLLQLRKENSRLRTNSVHLQGILGRC